MKVVINPATPIIICIGGSDYPCRQLTLGDALALEKNHGDSGGNKMVLDQLTIAGLPEEVAMQLTTDQIRAVVTALMPPKKS